MLENLSVAHPEIAVPRFQVELFEDEAKNYINGLDIPKWTDFPATLPRMVTFILLEINLHYTLK